MSQVNLINYKHQVCPACDSKKLTKRSLTRGSDSTTGHIPGWLCGNCDRFHIYRDGVKYTYDRAMMKRDMLKIKKFLDGDKK